MTSTRAFVAFFTSCFLLAACSNESNDAAPPGDARSEPTQEVSTEPTQETSTQPEQETNAEAEKFTEPASRTIREVAAHITTMLGFDHGFTQANLRWREALIARMRASTLRFDYKKLVSASEAPVEQRLFYSLERCCAQELAEFESWLETPEGQRLASVIQTVFHEREIPIAGGEFEAIPEDYRYAYQDLLNVVGVTIYVDSILSFGGNSAAFLEAMPKLGDHEEYPVFLKLTEDPASTHYMAPRLRTELEAGKSTHFTELMVDFHREYSGTDLETLRDLSIQAANAGAAKWRSELVRAANRFLFSMITHDTKGALEQLAERREQIRAIVNQDPWTRDRATTRQRIRNFPWNRDNDVQRAFRAGKLGTIEERLAEAQSLYGGVANRTAETRAMHLLETVLEEDPEQTEALILLGLLQARFARAGLDNYKKDSIRAPFHTFGMAMAYSAYERVLEIDPENTDAMMYLGMIEFYLGNDDRAGELYAQAFEGGSKNPWLASNMAKLEYTRGNVEAALDQLWAVFMDPEVGGWVKYWAISDSRRISQLEYGIEGMLEFSARPELTGVFFEKDIREFNHWEIFKVSSDYKSAQAELRKIPVERRTAEINRPLAETLVYEAALEPNADQEALLAEAASLYGEDLSAMHSTLIHRFEPLPAMLVLEKHGFSLNRNFGAYHPVCLLMDMHKDDVVKELLQAGVSPDNSDERRGPLIFCAALYGTPTSFKALVDAGARTDVTFNGVTLDEVLQRRRDEHLGEIRAILAAREES